MGYVLAIIFLIVAVALLALYSGTPHGGPTTICGPITFFNQTFNINADCRYVSVGELLAALVFFFLSVTTALASRPKGKSRR